MEMGNLKGLILWILLTQYKTLSLYLLISPLGFANGGTKWIPWMATLQRIHLNRF